MKQGAVLSDDTGCSALLKQAEEHQLSADACVRRLQLGNLLPDLRQVDLSSIEPGRKAKLGRQQITDDDWMKSATICLCEQTFELLSLQITQLASQHEHVV